MKHLVILLGIPLYLILSVLTGKFLYHILAPEVTFVGDKKLDAASAAVKRNRLMDISKEAMGTYWSAIYKRILGER